MLKNNGFHNRHSPFSRPFSPASFFANGEQGWWYDPSNFATLFQDSAGTTPVTAMEQPVGLQLDLSKGLTLGPELVTNGDFSGGTTGWTAVNGTASVVDGKFRVDQTGNSFFLARTQITGLTVGRTYKIVGSFVTITNGSNSQIWVGTAFGAQDLNYSRNSATPATVTVNFVAGATTRQVEFLVNAAGTGVMEIDNISVKELPGNHRFQTTSANRPVVSARVNLLTKTEQFDDAVWSKNQATVTANRMTTTSSTGNRFINQSVTLPVTGNIAYYAKIKAGTAIDCSVRFLATSDLNARFNLSSGSVVSGSGTISGPDANGYYTCTVTGAATGTSGQAYIYINDAASGVYVDLLNSDLRFTNQGVNLPAYQRVNTSTDYDSTGFPVYIKPNGSNQFMQTNSINFSATDKMTVWQGVRKLTNTAAIFTELGTGTSSNEFFLAVNAISNDYWVSLGADGAFTSGSYASPLTNVLTASYDLAGATADDEKKLRINGAQIVFASNSGTNTGNFINAAAYFYMRAGNSFIFNGHDYGSIARGAASTAAQITAGETYINSLTKAY